VTRRRSSRGRSSPTYRWLGVSFPPTILASTTTALNLVDSLQIDEMGGATLVRIRGYIELFQNNVAAGEYGMKIALEQIDDAGTPSSDINGRDTDEEDIARRQLWTKRGNFPAISSLTTTPAGTREFEIDVKVGVKIRAKNSVFLFADSTSSRVSFSGYIRALLRT